MLHTVAKQFKSRLCYALTGLFLAVLFTAPPVRAYNRIVNYAPPLTINQFLQYDSVIFAATSGGIFSIDPRSDTATALAGMERMPDLACKAMVMMPDRTLWFGTASGYLYHYNRTTRIIDVSSSYALSGWDIRALHAYGNYLIIGSSQGCSIFDMVNRRAIANAPHIGTFSTARVNAIAIHNDSLYLACDNGLASLDISGNKITRYTYNDPLIWTTQNSAAPLLSFTAGTSGLTVHTVIAALQGSTTIAAIDTVYWGNSADTLKIDSVPSAITTLYAANDTTLWIGTMFDYAWCRRGTALIQIKMPGPTVLQINRLYANRSGTDLWMLAQISEFGDQWHEGICRFDGNRWTQYNNSTPGFRWVGGYFDFRGVLEDNAGTMWFGAPGGSIKRYDTLEKTWSLYVTAEADTPWFHHLTADNPEQQVWSMNSALAQDSSGYIWMGIWHGYKGSLICYVPGMEPSPSSYRRFLSKYDNPSYYMENVYALNVDARGIIFAGSETGQLLVFSHSGQPITGGITIEKEWYTNPLGRIADMTSTSDNLTWIVSTQGLNVYNPATRTLTHINKVPASITSIEAEDDNIFWFGSADKGLIRYDRQSEQISYVNTGSGLPSNVVNDISLDRTNHALWLATDKGVSRYELVCGTPTCAATGALAVYPNPFSRTNVRHREIVFEQVPARARVSIYTLAGTLIATVKPIETDATVYTWIPDRSLVVGTYFYQIVSVEQTRVGKILITR